MYINNTNIINICIINFHFLLSFLHFCIFVFLFFNMIISVRYIRQAVILRDIALHLMNCWGAIQMQGNDMYDYG
jgi:hypothetical protein